MLDQWASMLPMQPLYRVILHHYLTKLVNFRFKILFFLAATVAVFPTMADISISTQLLSICNDYS